MWLTKHAPRARDDLAVNKKKVADVSDWLDESFKGVRGVVPILLLTGDSGVGKTATLQVLVREKSVDIIEWINPTSSSSSSDFAPDPSMRYGWDRPLQESSQTTQFSDFLLRVERYPTLSLTSSQTNSSSGRKILLVEDFPNAFLHNYSQFHDCLRKFSRSGNTRGGRESITPMVFIVSGNSGGSSAAERGLFPENLQVELRIQHIRFNPVPTTVMLKALTRVVTMEASRKDGGVVMPDTETLQEIIATSAGDIRSAMNALEFRILGQCRSLSSTKNSKLGSSVLKRSRTVRSTTRKKALNGAAVANSETLTGQKSLSKDDDSSGRDSSLSLFHALGKLFYCKRKPHANPTSAELPSHLSHQLRDELTFDPEGVVDRVAISSEYFVSFLHQNYVDFYTSLDDVASTADCLSECDELVCDWSARQMLRSYSSSVAARGVVFYNTGRARSDSKTVSIGWKPLHRPQCIDVAKRAAANISDAASVFSPLDAGIRLVGGARMLVETLPYLHMLSSSSSCHQGKAHSSGTSPATSFTQRQLAFLREHVSLESRTRNNASRLEKLDEHVGTLIDDFDDDAPEGSGTHPAGSLDGATQTVESLGSTSTQPPSSVDTEAVKGAVAHNEEEEDEDELLIESYEDD